MVDVAQLVRVADCGSEGRGFESHLPPEQNKKQGDVEFRHLFLFFDGTTRKLVCEAEWQRTKEVGYQLLA